MKNNKVKLISALALSLALGGCATEMFDDPNGKAQDDFLKGFINALKVVPAENHSYAMASQAQVTVRTSNPTDIQVVAKVGGKRYCFYEAQAVTDGTKLQFDIPCDVRSVYVVANGQNYPVAINGTVNLDKDPVRTGLSRANSTFYESFASKVCEVVDMRSSAEKSAEDLAKGMLGVHADLEGGRLTTSFETFTTSTTSWILQQELSACANVNLVANYEGSEFSDATIVPNWANPNIYIYYLRKPGGVNYTIGMMIGNDATLAESSTVYKIPMFDTSTMGSETFRMRQAKTDANTKKMVSATFDFANNKVTIASGPDHVRPWNQNITFNDAFKDQVRAMGEFCGNRIRSASLKTYLQCWDHGYTYNRTGSLPDYRIEPHAEYSNDAEYYSAYSTYLGYYFDDAFSTDRQKRDGKLHDVKEYLTRAGFQFMDDDEYPIVESNDATDTHVVTFFNAQGDHNWNGAEMVAATGANPSRHSLFEPDVNRFQLYYGINTYTALPDALNGNHEFVYYVEFKNNTEVGGKTVVTTGDEGVIKRITPTLNETGSPYDPDGARYCMDLDNDGIYDDLVFGAAGATPGHGWVVDKYQWLLACEDLGSTDDIDYNDIVVGVKVAEYGTTDTKIELTAMAAGGKMPAYLMYSEKDYGKGTYTTFFVGPEIHAWLGQPVDIYNTNPGQTLTGPNGKNPVKYTFPNAKNDDQPFSLAAMMNPKVSFDDLGYRFWVLVDKDNWLKRNGLAPADDSREFKSLVYEGETITDFHLWAHRSFAAQHFNLINEPGDKSYGGSLENPRTPLMICVGNDWEWPTERTDISKAYPKFGDWIAHPEKYTADPSRPEFVPEKWYGLDDDGRLIQGEGAPNRDEVTKRITPKTE